MVSLNKDEFLNNLILSIGEEYYCETDPNEIADYNAIDIDFINCVYDELKEREKRVDVAEDTATLKKLCSSQHIVIGKNKDVEHFVSNVINKYRRAKHINRDITQDDIITK